MLIGIKTRHFAPTNHEEIEKNGGRFAKPGSVGVPNTNISIGTFFGTALLRVTLAPHVCTSLTAHLHLLNCTSAPP